VRGHSYLAGPFKDDVEHPAGQAPGALDASYVPVHAPLKGQDGVAVDGHALILQVQDHDLARVLGEKEISDARGGHELYTLAGQRLLEEASQAPALVIEAHVALVGDHRA
jgi:hypothetical protein